MASNPYHSLLTVLSSGTASPPLKAALVVALHSAHFHGFTVGFVPPFRGFLSPQQSHRLCIRLGMVKLSGLLLASSSRSMWLPPRSSAYRFPMPLLAIFIPHPQPGAQRGNQPSFGFRCRPANLANLSASSADTGTLPDSHRDSLLCGMPVRREISAWVWRWRRCWMISRIVVMRSCWPCALEMSRKILCADALTNMRQCIYWHQVSTDGRQVVRGA